MKRKAGQQRIGRGVLYLLLVLVMLVNCVSFSGGTQARGIDSRDSTNKKNAYVNNSLSPQNGTAQNPVLVALDDEIKYTISTTNSKKVGTTSAVYDVLFVLDWSGSMSWSMTSSQNARQYERLIMEDMCGFVMEKYPNSRVAVMGMNTGPAPPTNCSNDPSITNIQYQTDFLDKAQYTANKSNITNAFNASPAYNGDDVGVFLQAGTDKMLGLSTSFGSGLSSGSKTVIPRTGSDLNKRIPVIILISDFQMTEGATYWNNSGVPYWTNVAKAHANRFNSEFPNGILYTIRLDHEDNKPFNEPLYDNLMTANLSPAGRAHWGFSKISRGTTINNGIDAVKSKFTGLVPFEVDKGTVITDVVPEGLEVDISSISHGGVYDPGTRTITWDLSAEKTGTIEVEFTTTVQQVPARFENTATIFFSDNTQGVSNTTYHETPLPPAPPPPPSREPPTLEEPVKNAYINNNLAPQNGTSQDPVLVALEDEIKYTITTINHKENGIPDFKYDILFVLDWSASMTQDMGTGQSAILYERSVMLDMCDFIMENYPDSRVAVLGLNSNQTNLNYAPNTYLQYQSDFLDAAQYETDRSSIASAFETGPQNGTDDNAIFLKAAVDKMEGLSTTFGSLTPGGSKTIIPRSGSDVAERIPVIIHISDFQMTNASGPGNYWSNLMKTQADRFDSLYPDGILQTVRFDHTGNSVYSTSTYDGYMTSYVSPAGRSHWGFTKVPYGASYTTALDTIKNSFMNSAPPVDKQGTIVIDAVPEGLEVNGGSISHGGIYDPITHTITWDLSLEDEGEITLEFAVTVQQGYTSFENTATALFSEGTQEDSNTTYHMLEADTSFVFYKVDEKNNPMQGVKFLLFTCTDEDPATHNHPWLVSDNSSSCWGDAEAVYSEVNGLVEFSDLSPGSYMLVEAETHTGYQLPQGQWLIEIDDTYVINITAHGFDLTTLPPAFKLSLNGEDLLLPNYRQMAMPLASGPGLITLTVLGIVLLADGIIYAILPRSKERRRA